MQSSWRADVLLMRLYVLIQKILSPNPMLRRFKPFYTLQPHVCKALLNIISSFFPVFRQKYFSLCSSMSWTNQVDVFNVPDNPLKLCASEYIPLSLEHSFQYTFLHQILHPTQIVVKLHRYSAQETGRLLQDFVSIWHLQYYRYESCILTVSVERYKVCSSLQTYLIDLPIVISMTTVCHEDKSVAILTNEWNDIVQCTLNYLCANYPVCGLSMHDRSLLMTNDEGGK
jgi:hypothetical protein